MRCTSSPWAYRSGIVGAGASFRRWRYSGVVAEPIAVQALATGGPAEHIARALVDRLAAPGLQVAFVFADHRLDPAVLARTQRALSAPVVGCTTTGTLGP